MVQADCLIRWRRSWLLLSGVALLSAGVWAQADPTAGSTSFTGAGGGSATNAAGPGFPRTVYQNTVRGGCVSGSTCISFDNANAPDGGTITFPPVPADALPIFGYLYFQYLTSTDCTVDRIGDFANATVNGVNINTLPFEEIDCLNAQACFGQVATHFYRVDVSSLFDECDLNVAVFELRGFGMGNSTDTDWVEGATLMVAYCSETSPSTEIILVEHPQVYGFGVDVTPIITYSWSGFNADGAQATLVLGIGNGQNFTGPSPGDDTVQFQTTSTPLTTLGDSGDDGLFDGDDLCPPGPFGNGGMYDNTVLDVSALVNLGDNTATFQIVGGNDCLDSNAAFLCVSSQDAPNNCVPDACIISTGSCCDRAALSCENFVAEDECLPPLEFTEATLCENLPVPCAPICGNGQLEPGEACDDGNTTAGDCCSPICEIEPSDTVCRPSAGNCDVAESCDGTTAMCPPDGFAMAGSVCRSSTGVCDPQEVCSGSAADCPPDVRSPAGTVCRPSTGECDPQETCDGSSSDCPGDVVITACVDDDGCCPSGCAFEVDNDCPGTGVIPTVSTWGLVVIALALLVAAKMSFHRKPSTA